jgi:hypothetical protein
MYNEVGIAFIAGFKGLQGVGELGKNELIEKTVGRFHKFKLQKARQLPCQALLVD